MIKRRCTVLASNLPTPMSLVIWDAVYVLSSDVSCGVLGALFGGCVHLSSLNSFEAQAGNGVLPFCFASVLPFIRQEENQHRIIIGKLYACFHYT